MASSFPESWGDDFFDKNDFQDPIDRVCVDALTRLKRFRTEGYDNLQDGDTLTEYIVSTDRGKVNTKLQLFASAFNSLHGDLFIQDSVPDYFCSIIASLVKNSLQWQAELAGNVVTQLLPDDEALQSHVDAVWRWNKLQRRGQHEFAAYRFYLGCEIAEITFRPEPTSDTWNLGYQVETSRLLFHWGEYFYEESDGVLAADPITATDPEEICD